MTLVIYLVGWLIFIGGVAWALVAARQAVVEQGDGLGPGD